MHGGDVVLKAVNDAAAIINLSTLWAGVPPASEAAFICIR